MWVALLFFFIIVIALIIILSWFVTSCNCTFDDSAGKILPGGQYKVGDKTYTVPNLPHKILGSEQKPSMERSIPKLPDSYLADLRTLVVAGFQTLRDAKVPFWVTGGTLFSAHVWKHLMPFDDDADVSVMWEDREYLWSPEFARVADQHGLEVTLLRGSTLSMVSREGAAVRLRRKNTTIPIMDIFFTKQIDQGHYAKINSWSAGRVVPNKNETWDTDWLLPLKDEDIDGMLWSLPNQPEKLLKKQYGEKCLETIQSPDRLVKTHKWISLFTNVMQMWKVIHPSAETDSAKLVNPRFRT